MNVQKLVKKFANFTALPIEINEVRDAILEFGIQDEITICNDNDMDPKILRGLYYQYTYHKVVYGDPIRASLIVYSGKLEPEWQRLVACKELIHILEKSIEKTTSLEEVTGLIEKLLGKFSSDEYNITDVMAAKDKLALYQAIPILFPEASRLRAIERIKKNELTIDQIATAACIPKVFIHMALEENWPELVDEIVCL